MDSKNLKTLAVIFAVLVGVSSFFWWDKKFESSGDKFKKATVSKMSSVEKGSVEKVVIEKDSKEKKELVFKDDKWLINGSEASKDKTEKFFDNLKKVKIEKMVSKNKERHDKFEVSKEKAIKITFTRDGKEEIFFIGKKGPQINSFYIRAQGKVNVYLAKGIFINDLEISVDDWTKKEDASKSKEDSKEENKKED